MGRASTPDPGHKAYRTKAVSLIRCMAEREMYEGWPPVLLPWDGPWVQAGRKYNVGAKMVIWMMKQGTIERRGDTKGFSVKSILRDWYRLPAPDEDLGDLWIE